MFQLLEDRIKLNPNSAGSYVPLGNAKYRLGDYSGALKEFDKSLELSPKSSHAYMGRAYTRYKMNNIKGACSDYKEAIKYKYPPKKFRSKTLANDLPLLVWDFKEINFCKL